MKKLWSLLLSLALLAGVGIPALAEEAIDYPALYAEKMQFVVDNIQDFFAAYGEESMVAPYEETVEFTMVNYYNTTIEQQVAVYNERYGETFDDNRFTDVIKQVYNADLNYKWWALDADYNQKLRLDMTANELPDLFLVRTQIDLAQLAEAGVIWDMTDIFDEYATTITTEMWNSDGGILIDMATFDDRLYGVPIMISYTDEFSYLWLRSDWMDALGLEDPKTVEDLVAIMDAFKAADFDGNGVDDTVGLIVDKGLFYSTRGLFQAYNAYPQYWLERDGKLVWGGTLEENKEALALLADLYKDGYLDTEFITKSGGDAFESMLNGKAGVIYGGHWVGHNLGDLHELDPDSDWRCVVLPSATGDPVRSVLKPVFRGWVAANINFEHPELANKIASLQTYMMNGTEDCDWWWYEQNSSWNLSPIKGSVPYLDNLNTYLNLKEFYEAGGTDESILKGKAVPYYSNLNGETAWEWQLMFGPEEGTPLSILEKAQEDDLLFFDAFTGVQSEFMQDRWQTIQDEMLIAYTKIIIGEVSVDDGFDAWLATWNSMGGDRITADVNEWYAEQ